jgi:small-conductance mechanosensitive channel
MEIVLDYVRTVSWQDILTTTLHITLILFIGWIGIIGLRFAISRLEQRLLARTRAPGEPPSEAPKRVETLVRLVRQAALIFLWLSILLVILNEIGIEIGPILASVGVLGIAIGFGAQNLVRDVISGFFFILENQVRVGDVAVVNGTGGLVEQINFRTIVLRDLSGTVHVLPNGTVDSLANMTRDWSAYVFDIGVAYKEDVDRVMDLLREIVSQMRREEPFAHAIIEDVEMFGVDKFGDSAVMIKGRIKTLPIRQWEVGREFLRRVKHAFDRDGIEIPFPHRSLYIGEATKPLTVQLLEQAGRGREGGDKG